MSRVSLGGSCWRMSTPSTLMFQSSLIRSNPAFEIPHWTSACPPLTTSILAAADIILGLFLEGGNGRASFAKSPSRKLTVSIAVALAIVIEWMEDVFDWRCQGIRRYTGWPTGV